MADARVRARYTPTTLASIDTARDVIESAPGSLVDEIRNRIPQAVALTPNVNDLDYMDTFFEQVILMGTTKPRGYPQPILPAAMGAYGIAWRDFVTEYGHGSREDLARAVIRDNVQWMAAAYWLTPDWVYNATYPELINYRRWLNPRVLEFRDWGAKLRANPCLLEEHVRQGMGSWVTKVLSPMWRQRKDWVATKLGPRGRAGATRLLIDALFYEALYRRTLEHWYATQSHKTTKRVPMVQEIAAQREIQRRPAQRRPDEPQTAPQTHARGRPVEMQGHTGRPRTPTPRTDIAPTAPYAPPAAPVSGAPSGGSTRSRDWADITASGKDARTWMADVLPQGFRERLQTCKNEGNAFGMAWQAYLSKGGDRAQKEAMREAATQAYHGTVVPGGSIPDAQERAELEANARRQRDQMLAAREREQMPAPTEPAPAPAPDASAPEPPRAPGITKHYVLPPEGGSEIQELH